jgi:hypothetical protein
LVISEEKYRPVLGWGTSFDDEESRALLAQRIALYARLIGSFFALLYLAGIAIVLVVAPDMFWAVHVHPGKLWNLAIIVLGFGVWWLLRRFGHSNLALVAGDAVLPVLLNVGVALTTPHLPAGFALTFMPLLISALALMFRAAIVPSPPLHTALIGALASAPTLWAQYQLAAREPHLPSMLTPGLVGVGTLIWCVALTLGTARISGKSMGFEPKSSLRAGSANTPSSV